MRADGTILARLRGVLRPWYGWTLTERRLVAGLLLFAALALAGRWVTEHTQAGPRPFAPPAGAEIP